MAVVTLLKRQVALVQGGARAHNRQMNRLRQPQCSEELILILEKAKSVWRAGSYEVSSIAHGCRTRRLSSGVLILWRTSTKLTEYTQNGLSRSERVEIFFLNPFQIVHFTNLSNFCTISFKPVMSKSVEFKFLR